MDNILLLASQSYSRRILLTQMATPFVLIDQGADEQACDWSLPLPKLVESIAKYKMEQVILPQGVEGQQCYVLTADTLTQDSQGTILGKPTSRDHAASMLKAVRNGAQIGTAFCLDKKIYRYDRWQIQERIVMVVQTECIFNVPDVWINRYLENTIALQCSGGIALEGYGQQFLQSLNGSYTAVLGLPVCELRNALEKLDFFI